MPDLTACTFDRHTSRLETPLATETAVPGSQDRRKHLKAILIAIAGLMMSGNGFSAGAASIPGEVSCDRGATAFPLSHQAGGPL